MAKTKIYLDNCSYNRPFDDQRQMRIYLETQAKLYIQHLIVNDELILVCSYMSVYENKDNPHEERFFSIKKFLRHADIFIDHDKSGNIEEKAQTIMKYNIKIKDAIHVACAIEAGCDYFITTDDDIAKKYTGDEIIICSPIDFINNLEEYNE
jgi:predicted nucleic acid-binding protein